MLTCSSDMGATLFFYSIQLSLRKFWFDSTHDSQWLSNTWFKSTQDPKRISETSFKSTHDLKSFQKFDSNQLTTQKVFQNIDSNQLMTQWCISLPVSYDLFWAFNFTVDFAWSFLGFPLKCWLRMTSTRMGLSTQVPYPTNWFESAHDSSSISETWIDSVHDSSGFPGIDSESTQDSNVFPGINSDRLMIQNAFRFFDPNQVMTRPKSIRFWVDSWFDSESYQCLLLVYHIDNGWLHTLYHRFLLSLYR